MWTKRGKRLRTWLRAGVQRMWICLYKMWLLYKSNVGITARKAFVFRKVNSLVPGATRRVQKNTQYQQATPLDCHTGFLSVSPAAACQGESLKPLEKFTIWRNRRHEENDFICCRNICRKCGRCNCNVHFTGEQKISEGERKWQVLIWQLEIRKYDTTS